MLDLKFIRKHPDLVQEALEKRSSDLRIEDFQELDARRRALIQEVENLKSKRNQASGEVARLKRNNQDAKELISSLSELSEKIRVLDIESKEIDARVHDWLLEVPNIPHPDTPFGRDEDDNQECKQCLAKPEFDFIPRQHWEIGNILGGLDFERSAKITGSRFALYWDWAPKMERALINFMLDIQNNEHGYTEVMPPFIVNQESMQGTGQLPKFAQDLFKLEGWDYYLIPTAEVPVTNIHRNEVLNEDDLPLGYSAFTPCFRSEAGSYGKDTKGLIRQHQFNKVELVRFVHPECSYQELELLLGHAEAILQRLKIHYRVVTLCSGDLGFSAAKTYDLEVWLPGQNKYREISSCSNFEDFQARRANIRYKSKQAKKNYFVHTLNGSGLAVGRTLVAILENYQQKDGSVVVPEVLRPYMQGREIIEPRQ